MGGSGGGYSDYSGGDGGSLNCATIDFPTTLLSTNPDILLTLKIGKKLPVVRGEYSAIVQTKAGDRVGSIVTNASQLLACMDGGSTYIAEVLDVEEGACRVRVTFGVA